MTKKCGDRCCCKCCKKCSKCFKPGLCRCWHCCACWLIPILIMTLPLLGMEIYLCCIDIANLWIRIMIYLSLITSALFICLIQLTFFFIRNEFSSCKSIIFWSLLFGVTLILGVGAFVLTFICPTHCKFSDEIIDIKAAASSKEVKYTQIMRWICLGKLILILLVMHIYIYYTYLFYREKKDKADPCCEAGIKKAMEKHQGISNGSKSKKVAPEREHLSSSSTKSKFLQQNRSKSNLKIKLFYAKL